jgi:hypothetical protein
MRVLWRHFFLEVDLPNSHEAMSVPVGEEGENSKILPLETALNEHVGV